MLYILTAIQGVLIAGICFYGIGSLILKWLTGDAFREPAAHLSLSIALGMLAASFALLIVGVSGLYTGFWIITLSSVFFLTGAYRVVTSWSYLAPSVQSGWRFARRRWWIAIPLAALLAVEIGHVALPCTAFDTWNYRFAIAEIWLKNGLVADTGATVYDGFNHGMTLLFGAALAIGGERAATGVAWLVFALLPIVCVAVARAAGWRPPTGLYATAILFAIHQVPWQPGRAHIDNAVLLLALAAVVPFILLMRNREAGAGVAVVAGLLLGGSVAVKLNGIIAAGTMVAAYAAVALSGGDLRRVMRTLAMVACAFLALAVPWLAWSYVVTGNPLYPALNSLFGASGHGLPFGETATQRGFTRTVSTYLTYPWHLSFNYGLLCGSWDYAIGPAIIAFAPICLFYRRGKVVAFLAIFTGGYLTVSYFIAPQMVRYLMPALGAMALLAALGAESLQRVYRASVAVNIAVPLLIIGPLILSLGLETVRLIDGENLAFLSGRIDGAEYLRGHRHTRHYVAIERINEELPAGAKLLLTGRITGYHVKADWVDIRRFYSELPEGRSDCAECLLAELRERGFSHVVTRVDAERLMMRALAAAKPIRANPKYLLYDESFMAHFDAATQDRMRRVVLTNISKHRDETPIRPAEGGGYWVAAEWIADADSETGIANLLGDHLRVVLRVEEPDLIEVLSVEYPTGYSQPVGDD